MKANTLHSGFEAPRPLTVLITGDEDGVVLISLNGIIPIAQLQLVGPAAVAVACCASGDLRTLLIWTQTVDGPKLDTYNLELLTRDRCKVATFVYHL